MHLGTNNVSVGSEVSVSDSVSGGAARYGVDGADAKETYPSPDVVAVVDGRGEGVLGREAVLDGDNASGDALGELAAEVCCERARAVAVPAPGRGQGRDRKRANEGQWVVRWVWKRAA